METLPKQVTEFVEFYKNMTKPDAVHLVTGSAAERQQLTEILLKQGTIEPLPKYDNCYLARTCPEDVARVESRTYMCTPNKEESVPLPKDPALGQLGNWANDVEMREKLYKLFDGCMAGRTMYVLPFCMGPLGSKLAKIGVQLTDSPYVVLSMGTMTTMGSDAVLPHLDGETFIKCVHSVGVPLPLPADAPAYLSFWPCNPPNTHITQFPHTNEIISFGSGYGGNSLLGKKCFALRMAGNLAKKEGWLAEHMLIMGLQNEQTGDKKYIAAAFPSACGKTNLAMLTPTIPGWKVTCVGDDIAWMKFDPNGTGELRAVNPEKGFFGVAPGTNNKTNPIAMKCIHKDTIFTNVAKTSDGGVFWEGLEDEVDLANVKVTDWLGKEWTPGCGRKAAHPNSRFCAPIRNCPILDEHWDDPEGVKISAIIFGGRRPKGQPLVLQSFSWNHGVLMGAGMKSETTAAASDMKANTVAHDPFAMRPFLGYNAAKYVDHWCTLGEVNASANLPKIFVVNWFQKDEKGSFIWPGFGDNCRVLKWVCERCDNKDVAVETPVGYVPKPEAIDLSNLVLPDEHKAKLFEIDTAFWVEEAEELDQYFIQFFNNDYPEALKQQVSSLKQRLA